MNTWLLIAGEPPAPPSAGADSSPETEPGTPRSLVARKPEPAVLDTLRTSWTYCNAAGDRLGSSAVWLIGAVSSAVGALTATTLFTSLQSDTSGLAKAVVGVAVGVSALLAGLQTYLVRHRDEVSAQRNQLHRLHCEIEDALHKWQQGTDFEADFGKTVRERLAAIDTSAIRAHGGHWHRAQQSTRDKMRADFGLV